MIVAVAKAAPDAAGWRDRVFDTMALKPSQSILEGIITTLRPHPVAAPMSQRVNISPMGPIVEETMSELLLRPFNTSTTYKNLKATGQGVFHVTDDVLLLARAAVGQVPVAADVPVRPASTLR